jgi:hypothetical protein
MLNRLKRIPGRPERGVYLAVIGVLLGSLLFVMNENRQMRHESTKPRCARSYGRRGT